MSCATDPHIAARQQRCERALAAVAAADADALLIIRHESLDRHSMRYLTGFTGSSAFALLTTGARILLTDARYLEQVRQECPEWELRQHGRPPIADLARAIAECGVRRLAFEPAGVTYELWAQLNAALSGAGEVELVAVPDAVDALRLVKDAQEVAAIAEACRLADAAFAELLPQVVSGAVEGELALQLELLMRRGGAAGIAFETIVASGPHSARPHARPTDRQLQRGDLVVFDFGARVDGYCGDMTRTVMVGAASDEQRRLYETVRAVQRDAVAAVRAGVVCGDVATAADAAVAAAGYGDYPSHSLGHGVGLEIHEGPALRVGSEQVLQPGHVVTVEPGIYVPDVGGVRIEDLLVIEADGSGRILTSTDRELLELPLSR